MRSLKDLASAFIISDLNEGILDDIEDTIEAGDEFVDNEVMKKWFKNDKCKVFKTKKGYVIRGDFKIDHNEGETWSGPTIKTVQGNISIVGTELTTLEGMFNADTEVTGTLTIEDNPNLTSLKGCPAKVGTLVVCGNPKLTSIDAKPIVSVNAYVSKNGKRWSKDQLAKQLTVAKKIFCSVEDDANMVNENEESINEAFKAPQLKPIALALKNAQLPRNDHEKRIRQERIERGYLDTDEERREKIRFDRLFDLEWDKIEANRITEYDGADPKAVTACRNYLTGKTRGMIALMDVDGDVTSIIIGKTVWRLKNRYSSMGRYERGDQFKSTAIISMIEQAASVLLVDLSGIDTDALLAKRKERYNNREGALYLKRGTERKGPATSAKSSPYYSNDINADRIRYYQTVANENRQRYKIMVTKIKAERAAMSTKFAQIKERLDKAFDRYTAILAKIIKDPAKYKSYSFEWLNNQFMDASAKDKYSVRESGLFVTLEQYVRYLISARQGSVADSSKIAATLKSYEDTMTTQLDRVEYYLRDLEAVQ